MKANGLHADPKGIRRGHLRYGFWSRVFYGINELWEHNPFGKVENEGRGSHRPRFPLFRDNLPSIPIITYVGCALRAATNPLAERNVPLLILSRLLGPETSLRIPPGKGNSDS
jgi:hypothetical protein